MGKLTIFLVHGRPLEEVRKIKAWFKRHYPKIEIITYAGMVRPGETITSELERIANLGDAAIVLATPDDVGGLANTKARQARARQNVWLEFGWFWARLGTKRAVMLFNGKKVERPSDTDGLNYLHYETNLNEIESDIAKFIAGLGASEDEDIPEVLHTDSSAKRRANDYQLVCSSASKEIIVTGIGMANIRHDLPRMFKSILLDKPGVELVFITLSKSWVRTNRSVAEAIYRENILYDIEAFERDLRRFAAKLGRKRNRVSLLGYPGIMTFSATVADPGAIGSIMAAEVILPATQYHNMARPRFMLRKRGVNGIYDRFLAAILHFQKQSDKIRL